ncbi:hypothetical protein GOB13_23325 [Sinorhizobium meliloti]|uniref:hypothetical protein n=1 Tax=Rhizobium meliloti TaxID=382 RepID=UPI00299EDAC2|nr:hypothetical protein [Sinorhizobium meliloti]MDX0084220.1 hypothetical protein [Sinorhizobium meliloti]
MKRAAFDLNALASDLAATREKGYEHYRAAIKQFASAASTYHDLIASRDSIRTIVELQRNDHLRKAVGPALMTHAVLCYCRALDKKSKGRSTLDIEATYSEELLRKHKAIKDLRSTALAHYDRGKGPHGDIWVQDKIVTRTIEGRLSSVEVYLRSNFRAAAIYDLMDLLVVAVPYVRKERERRKTVLDSLFNEALDNDPAFVARLEQHPFNHDEFFEGTGKDSDGFWSDEAERGETFSMPRA